VSSVTYEPPQEIVIEGTEIELNQFLKLSRAVSSGGEGKALIQQGAVRVNGEVETRRSRKLRSGDVVRLAGRGIYRVKGADQETH
jgi:Uncharacterized conserved protein